MLEGSKTKIHIYSKLAYHNHKNILKSNISAVQCIRREGGAPIVVNQPEPLLKRLFDEKSQQEVATNASYVSFSSSLNRLVLVCVS